MRKLFFIFFIAQSFVTVAQTETAIHSYYDEVNKKIIESIEEDIEGPLYNNQWITNNHKKNWPAVGFYADTTNFWYNDPPDHIDEGTKPETVLQKVTISQRATYYYSKEEYLFKEGKLLFYSSWLTEGGDNWETKFYYSNDGSLLKSIIKLNDEQLSKSALASNEYKDILSDYTYIFNNGKKYQDLFVKSMLPL